MILDLDEVLLITIMLVVAFVVILTFRMNTKINLIMKHFNMEDVFKKADKEEDEKVSLR